MFESIASQALLLIVVAAVVGSIAYRMGKSRG